MKEKSKIVEIISKERISEEDKMHLKKLLQSLSKEELLALKENLTKNNMKRLGDTMENSAIVSDPDDLSIKERLQHLNMFIKDLLDVLDLRFQTELSEYMDFSKRRYLTLLKSYIKCGRMKGMPKPYLAKAYAKIRDKFGFESEKLVGVEKIFDRYTDKMGYKDYKNIEEDPECLVRFKRIIRELKRVLGISTQAELCEYMDFNLNYLTDIKGILKNGLAEVIPIDSLLKARTNIRANLILNSDGKNKDEKLKEVDKIVYTYIKHMKYEEESESALYLPLKRLQCSLMVLSHKAKITKKGLIVKEFDKLFGRCMHMLISQLNTKKQNNFREEEFLAVLNEFEIKNSGQFEQSLKNEFISEISTFKMFLKEQGKPLIRKGFEGTTRGKFLKHISDTLYEFLPDYVFVPRTLFSKLLFGNKGHLFKHFQRKSCNSLFIGEETVKRMIKNVKGLEYSVGSIGSLYLEKRFTKGDLNQFKSEALPIIKHFGDIGEKIYFNEECVGFLIKKILEGYEYEIEKNYKPSYMVSGEGDQRQLDWYINLPNHKELLVEVNGYWHQNDEDIQEKDRWKVRMCKREGVPLAVIETFRIFEREEYNPIRLVDMVCENEVIRKICCDLRLMDRLETIQKYYNQKEHFIEIVEEVYAIIRRQEEAQNGQMQIDNWEDEK